MLQQVSIAEIRQGKVARKDGYLVATMCYYPRGLRRALLDEYRSDLAPDRKLFAEWKAVEREAGHEAAFVKSRYEKRFTLSPRAIEKLGELSLRAQREPVFLACQCALGERCHREMLMLLAREELGAPVGRLYHSYPTFRKRIPGLLLAQSA
jgi:uncharacterized protein YeaO (DUF488 family)